MAPAAARIWKEAGKPAAGIDGAQLLKPAEPHAASHVKRAARVEPASTAVQKANLVVIAITMTMAARNGSSLVIRQKRWLRSRRPAASAFRALPRK